MRRNKTTIHRDQIIYFLALGCFLAFSALGAGAALGAASAGLGAALGAILITLGFLAFDFLAAALICNRTNET